MKDIFQFVYGYYEYYFILLTGVIGSFIAFIPRRKSMQSVRDKCIFFATVFCLIFLTSILFKHQFVPNREGMREHIIAFCIENILVLILSVGYVSVALKLVNIFNNCKIPKWIISNKWGIAIGFYLLINMLLRLPGKVNNWVALWYATDYSMGIGSRFLIGSFLQLFYDEYLDSKLVYHFCLVVMGLVILLISILLNHIIKQSTWSTFNGIIFLVIIFLVSPASVFGLFTYDNMGRLETYGLLCALLAVVLFEKISNLYLKYGVVTILSCLSMAIYQGNIFMYYPIIVMLLMYDGIYSSKNILLKRSLGCLNILLTGITFVYFQFFSYTNFHTAEEMVEVLSKKTNLPIKKDALDFELFQPLSVAYDTINRGFLDGAELPREKTFFTLLLVLPIIVLIMSLYLKCREYRIRSEQKIFECPYIYLLILPLAILPQYLLNVDWGRYMIATFIVIFTGIFYLYYKQDRGMLLAIERLGCFIERHRLLCLILILYLTGLDKITARNFMIEVDTITEWLVDKMCLRI